jgi:hypothetical protein
MPSTAGDGFADAPRGSSKAGSKAGATLRSDLVIKGKEGGGALGEKGRSIFKVDLQNKVRALSGLAAAPGPVRLCVHLVWLNVRAVPPPRSCVQLERPAPLEPAYQPERKSKALHAGRLKSNFAAVSAESAPALRQFADAKKKNQAALLLEDQGMSLLNECMTSGKSGGNVESAKANLRHILYRDYHFVHRSLQMYDKTGTGTVSRRDFLQSLPSLVSRTPILLVALKYACWAPIRTRVTVGCFN